MIKRSFMAGLAACVALTVAAGAWAQTSNQVRKPGTTRQPSQADAIKRQQQGQYPAFQRSTLPRGAINYHWAGRCKPDESTQNVVFKAGEEIRFRTRHLIGTVVVFPEEVSPVVNGLGDGITLAPYPKSSGNKARIWIFGTKAAGIDGNVVFIAGVIEQQPRLYAFRIQTEGVNTQNCPDLIVNVHRERSAFAPVAENIARTMIDEGVAAGTPAPAPGAVPRAAVELAGKLAKPGQSAPDEPDTTGTGRQAVDWLEGFKFDPSKLDFHWKLSGIKEADFAPDIVFSDDEFLYLQWEPARMKTIMLPAISAVIPTDRGKLDGPVPWVRRGNTVIVQRVTNLTLEFEGLVVCVTREVENAEGK